MFTHIMVPIDLAEKDSWNHATLVACDLAEHFSAKITLVSVSGGIQGKVSHSTQEYGRRLAVYAHELATEHGVEVGSMNYGVPDPSVEVDQKLLQAIAELEIDLVVMASHRPGWVEYFVNSHGGRLASHAPISVFVVRDPALDD
ncbi:universal stress protein [Roseovarius sp. 2305UL8-3]|uniref:universal stress protein n=1 Tax=Roseovarius conchicola TaxID=3121636 RepID=UPI0035290C7B